MTNPAGDFTTYGYDAAGNRTRVTDANQHDTFYAYDKLNWVVTTTDHLNGQTIVRYDAVGNRTQTIDAENRVTTYTYDSVYRLTKLTDAKNQETLSSYDALGNKLTETDAETIVTRLEYDRLNRLITTTQNYSASGPSNFETNVKTVLTYDGLSRQTRLLDGLSHTTLYGYDGLDRTTVITDALNHATRYSYDGRGNQRSVINGDNETTQLLYDGADRLITISQIISPLPLNTKYEYNKAGERTKMIDAENVETRYGYDALGRLTSVIENYQDGVFVISITDQDVKTQYGYDKVGNQKVITDAKFLGGQGGAVTQFQYDNIYQVTQILYSDSTPDVTFTYDKVGNRKTMLDGTGTTTYSYDKLYRFSSVLDGHNKTVGYGHDQVGNRTRLTYPDGKVLTYTYNAGDLLTTVTRSWSAGQFGYNYDNADRMTKLSLPSVFSSNYTYDDAGRLTALAHQTPTKSLASYSYGLDKLGNRRTLTESLLTTLKFGSYQESGGSVVIEGEHLVDDLASLSHEWQVQTGQNGYTGTGYIQPLPDIDALYQTNEISSSPRVDYPIYFTTPGTYTLWLRGYPPNAAGDSVQVGLKGVITTVTGFAPGGWGWSNKNTNGQPARVNIPSAGLYTLNLWMREDGLRVDRLVLTTSTTYTPTGFGPTETDRYTAGEISPLTQITRTIVYTYDDLYHLTQATYTTGQNYQYQYDPVGNRLKQIANGDTTDYLYDAANRLASVTRLSATQPYTFDRNGNLSNSGVMTNAFDGANRLVSSNRSTATVQPIYNGVGDRVRQVVSGTTTFYTLDVEGLPEVITSAGEIYVHLPGVIVTEKAGQVRYLLGDGLGSIRQAISGTGAVVAYSEFDPWGNPVQEGSQPYGFTGEWWQDELDLLHLRARWYAPEIGTFLSKDSWSGNGLRSQSMNGWSYVEGNPINFADPFGYFKCDPLTGECDSGYRLCVVQGQWKGAYVNGKPCIVDPNNVQQNTPASLPSPPALPPSTTRPGGNTSSSNSCSINFSTGLTDCERFVQEVQKIITLSKAQGMTDGATVMILAQYYSNIRIQARYLQSPYGGALLPGNPAWPAGYFRNEDIERYPTPPQEQIAQYGFKKIFWNNTHHYFADFYHTYFLGVTASFVGAYGREELQSWQGENTPEETQADRDIHWIAQGHALQVSHYSPILGPYVASLLPGKIEILPTLLRTDACEALVWTLAQEN